MNNSSPIALVTGGLISLAIAMGIGRFLYTPVLPVMMAELGLSAAQAGVIASFNYIGYLVGALLAGTAFIQDRQRNWLLAGLTLSSITTLTMGLTGSMSVFLLLRFLAGVASAFVLVFSSALMMEQLGRINRPQLIGTHFAGIGVGVIVSTLLSWLLIKQGNDWSSPWLASGILSLLAVPLVALLIPAGFATQTDNTGNNDADKKMLHKLTLSYGLFGFGYVITATFLIAIVRTYSDDENLEAVIWIIFGFSAIFSTLMCNALAKRIGMLNAYASACTIMAIGISLSVLWQALAGLVLAAIFLGATLVGGSALALAAARSLSGRQAHRSLALVTVAFSLGQIIGPIFAGFLKDYSGSYVSPSLTAALAMLLAAILVFNKTSN